MLSDLLIKVDEAEHMARLENADSQIINLLHEAKILLRFRESNKANVRYEHTIARNILGLNKQPVYMGQHYD